MGEERRGRRGEKGRKGKGFREFRGEEKKKPAETLALVFNQNLIFGV